MPGSSKDKQLPIVIATSYMGDIRHTGGVARHIQLLEDGLKDLGYEVKIITRASLGRPLAYLFSLPKIANWLVPGLGTALWALTAGFVQRLIIWFVYRGQALWIFEDPYGFLADKTPNVLFVHCLESEVKQTLYGEKGLSGWASRCLCERESYAMQTARCPVTVSSEYAKYIKDEFSLDIPVILNAIEMEQKPREYEINGKLELLAVGVLDQRKNFVFLLDVMQDIEDRGIMAHLTVAGDGPLKSRLEHSIIEKGLEEHVTLAGYISDRELEACYQRAHILVHPSLLETFGLVLLEARKYGLVTMVTSFINVPDELCDHKLPLEAAAWVECIEKYAREPAMIASTGRQGYETVKDKYSIKNMVHSMLKLAREKNPQDY